MLQNTASSTLEEPKNAERTTDDVAPTPREPPTPSEALIAVLRQEAKVMITGSTSIDCSDQSIDFGGGNMLELDTPESLHPKTGCVVGMVIVFDCHDILEVHQNTEKEEASSAA